MKMASHHEMVLVWCVVLAAAATLECDAAAAAADASRKAKPQIELVVMEVDMTNDLEGRQDLQVHCKDAHHDFGVQHVPYGQTYKIEFQQAGGGDDYYCAFVFDNVLRWFDIYVFTRDYRSCGCYAFCSWVVKQDGPCLVSDYDPPDCYPWNPSLS